MKNSILKSALIISTLMFVTISVYAQSSPEVQTLKHVLLFQWKAETPADIKAEAVAIFEAMPEKIEGFQTIEVYDLKFSSSDYNMIIIQEFVSEEALKAYESHADHQAFIELTGPNMDSYSVNDYWSKS
ncbi:Dabb family protein [Galbibacter sp. EGI 63066]|uniref:Dabb family protein n=1 Tax=Galbibacter sp. EGI 63066 TaxID=2993559 RepID=UPI002249747B|nr:Dabb family protein [Galbibacter sp. EGI 63066]MCX2680186.1 Dabb family protein [Galbibacter sp. EGI 63066]